MGPTDEQVATYWHKRWQGAEAEIERLEARVEELENEIRRLCVIVEGDENRKLVEENSRLWAWAAEQRCSGSKFVPTPSKPWADSEYEYRCGKCLPCEAWAKERQDAK